MHKKILCGALIGMMCLSMTACGGNTKNNKEPATTIESSETTEATSESTENVTEGVTAESLIDGIDTNKHKNDIFNGRMNMEASMNVNSGDKSVNMSMNGEFTLEGNEKASHTKGIVTVVSDGYNESDESDVWTVYGDDGSVTSYTRDMTTGTWYKEIGTAEALKANDVGSTLKSEYFTELAVEESGDEYVVTGKIDPKYIDDSLTDLTSSAGSVDDAALIDMTLRFNKDSKEYNSIEFDFTNAMSSMGGVSVDKFVMTVYVDSYVQGDFSLPADIEESAVESSTANDAEENTTVETEDTNSEMTEQ